MKYDQVHLTTGTLVLNALYKHTGSDSDDLEQFFYQLNPLVFGQHIAEDGVYNIPIDTTSTSNDKQEAWLLWE